jgi:aspartate/methionine/tyrosine aminotransferase
MPQGERTDRLADRVTQIAPSATVRMADLAAGLRERGISVIDLSAGRSAEPTPPYVVDAAVHALRGGQTHQTVASGTTEFRRACAAKLARENGLEADPDREILATMGVKQGIGLSLLATLNPGDEVIVEDPCFVSYGPLIRIAGGTPVPVALRAENGFRWTRADLEARLTGRTRALLLNSPQNPTGTVHTAHDLDLVASIAREHDLLVISDEVYERVTWGGRRHVSLASRPGARERTVTVMSLTKSFAMGGWRIGFVLAPPQIRDAMVTLQQHLITCPNSFVQAGAAEALSQPPRAVVVELWREWERRCEYLTGALNAMPGVRCEMPEGGFYAWVDISRLGRPSAEVAETLLHEHHLAVVPGSAFGATGEGYLRLTCVRSWAELEAAVPVLRRGL